MENHFLILTRSIEFQIFVWVLSLKTPYWINTHITSPVSSSSFSLRYSKYVVWEELSKLIQVSCERVILSNLFQQCKYCDHSNRCNMWMGWEEEERGRWGNCLATCSIGLHHNRASTLLLLSFALRILTISLLCTKFGKRNHLYETSLKQMKEKTDHQCIRIE